MRESKLQEVRAKFFSFLLYTIQKLIILYIMKAATKDFSDIDESDGNPEVTYIQSHRSLRPKGENISSRKTTARAGESRNKAPFMIMKKSIEPKPVHSLAKFTCKDYLYSPSQLDHMSYNHMLLYKSLQSFPLRQNVKSFKAYSSGVENAAAVMTIKADKRPQSAIDLDKIKYGSIREFIKRKELQQIDEAPRYYAELAKNQHEYKTIIAEKMSKQ